MTQEVTNRLKQLREWIERDLGITDYSLLAASEDASFRRYFRLSYNGESRIIMDAPPEREDCRPYLDICGRLRACKVNAPLVEAQDLEAGFLLLTDFGVHLYLDVINAENADTLYGDAIAALLRMQADADSSGLPLYDSTLLQAEMGLFRDWLLGRHLQRKLDAGLTKDLTGCFAALEQSALEQPRRFVHRDYHSRNLMSLERESPGILDFQDAVLGPLTYDLVSLLKDCYIKWPADQVLQWVGSYYGLLDESVRGAIAEPDFVRAFELMGVQRHLKAAGIFCRLNHRDGKPGYLADIPRTLSYIVDLSPRYNELGFLVRLIEECCLPQLELQR